MRVDPILAATSAAAFPAGCVASGIGTIAHVPWLAASGSVVALVASVVLAAVWSTPESTVADPWRDTDRAQGGDA